MCLAVISWVPGPKSRVIIPKSRIVWSATAFVASMKGVGTSKDARALLRKLNRLETTSERWLGCTRLSETKSFNVEVT